jgi:hypothetical protein
LDDLDHICREAGLMSEVGDEGALNDVSSDGFRTTEHPVEIAGNAPSIATKNGA